MTQNYRSSYFRSAKFRNLHKEALRPRPKPRTFYVPGISGLGKNVSQSPRYKRTVTPLNLPLTITRSIGGTVQFINGFRTLERTCALYRRQLSWMQIYWNDRNALLFTARDGSTGLVVGSACCLVRPKTIYVAYICSVKPGVGRALMHMISEEAVRIRKPYVELVSVENAIGFYKKLGFVRGPIDNTPDRQREARLSAVQLKAVGRLNNHNMKKKYLNNTDEAPSSLPKYHKIVIASTHLKRRRNTQNYEVQPTKRPRIRQPRNTSATTTQKLKRG